MVQRFQVVLFLTEIKKLVAAGQVTFVNRKKNLKTLVKYGWSLDSVMDTLLQLQPAHYSGGPETDIDRPDDEVWIFGIESMDNIHIYCKLKLTRTPDMVVCLSFHESERAMHHPFA